MMRWQHTLEAALVGMTTFGGSVPAIAATQAPTALDARAAEVASLFGAKNPSYATVFSPEFLQAVPASQLAAIFEQYHSQFATVTRTHRLEGGDRWHGKFEYAFAKGVTVKADLAVDEQAPHKIVGLLLGNPTSQAASLADIAKAFAALSGHTTFQATAYGPQGPRVLAGHDADRALAIGSSFKLWILGALIQDVADGKRRWDQVVQLTAAGRSLPSGKLQDWPVGSPITLHTLAALMISESDNTATDMLLAVLGRERVEATMTAMGTRNPARNQPMLGTLEMFKIKAGSDAGAVEAWKHLDEAARRTYLAMAIAPMKSEAVASWNTPRALADVEWFASAADLGTALIWLRDHTAAGEAAKGREVLAINPGMRLDPISWPYIGFKGGSEPGVVAAAFLLRGKDGTWRTLTAAWNDDAKEVDSGTFFGLLERAADLMAESH